MIDLPAERTNCFEKGGKMPKTLGIIAVVVTLSMLVVGCNGAGGVGNPIELIPGDSDVMVYVDLSMIEEQEDLESLYGSSGMLPADPETAEDVLEILQGLQEMWVFADLEGATALEAYAGMLVKGDFVENDLVAEIEAAMEADFTTVEYKSYEILTDETGESALVFLSGDTFVVGSMDAVEDAISVKEGDEPAVGGKLLSTYNSLSSADMRMAMIVPPGVIDEGLGDGMGGLELPGMESLADMETLGLTVDESGGDLAMEARMCFTSEDSAQDVYDLIEFVVDLLEMGAEDSPELQELVDNINLSQSGSCVNFSVEVSESQAEELMEGLGGFGGGMPF